MTQNTFRKSLKLIIHESWWYNIEYWTSYQQISSVLTLKYQYSAQLSQDMHCILNETFHHSILIQMQCFVFARVILELFIYGECARWEWEKTGKYPTKLGKLRKTDFPNTRNEILAKDSCFEALFLHFSTICIISYGEKMTSRVIFSQFNSKLSRLEKSETCVGQSLKLSFWEIPIHGQKNFIR